MEEYFPPLGTDHQIILDERTERFPFALLPFLLGGCALLLIGLMIGGWIWQQRVSFSVPPTPLSVTLSSDGQRWLANQSIIPASWHTVLTPSRFTTIAGGMPDAPTWAIVPRWIHLPSEFRTQETHGLYKLALRTDISTDTRSKLSIREGKTWLHEVTSALGGARWQPDESNPATVISWNVHLAVSSLPYSVHGDLSSTDDVSYLLQKNSFDSAFLATVILNHQNIASWQHLLQRVSWTGNGIDRHWELLFSPDASGTNPFLPGQGISEQVLLDGSTIRTFTSTSTLLGGNMLHLGQATSSSPATCPIPLFQPFLRVRGETALRNLPSWLTTTSLTLIEVGSFHEHLAMCFDTSLNDSR